MGVGRSLGRRFGWLWAAYSVSALGSCLAFDALRLVAILVLHAGPTEVALLAATGLAVGAALAVPLGPWVELHRKRPVMIAMDLVRFAALASVPVAAAFGRLGLAQLLVVVAVVAAADTAFTAASGAYLKELLPPRDLLAANARFETTTWTTTALGLPLGGAAVGLLGPVATVVADAVSYLLSAAGLRAIGGREPRPTPEAAPVRAGDLLAGWRYLLAHPVLRRLFLNTVLVNGLILAPAPLLAVLMLGPLGFAPIGDSETDDGAVAQTTGRTRATTRGSNEATEQYSQPGPASRSPAPRPTRPPVPVRPAARRSRTGAASCPRPRPGHGPARPSRRRAAPRRCTARSAPDRR